MGSDVGWLFDCFYFLYSKTIHTNHQEQDMYTKWEQEDTGGIKENNVWNSHLGELKSVKVIWLGIDLAV